MMGPQPTAKNLPLTLAFPECQFALIGAQLRDDERKKKKEELREKQRGRGKKENLSERILAGFQLADGLRRG